jgi:hypothetical protein
MTSGSSEQGWLCAPGKLKMQPLSAAIPGGSAWARASDETAFSSLVGSAKSLLMPARRW